MEKINYFDRMLDRYQSLPRSYGSNLLLFSSEADLLEEIGDHEPITATELARRKISTPSAISQIVKKLDSKNLLQRDTLNGNRKTIYLRLSEEGRKIYEYHRCWKEKIYESYMDELRDYSAADIAKAGGLINFLSEKYLEDFNSLDM
jgi:DNA-binding MarR family transcriptional regulator